MKTFLALSSVQSVSHIWLFVTPWTAACQASLWITSSQSLLKLTSIELVMPSTPHGPLLLPSIFSSIRVFSMSQLFTSGGQTIGVSVSVSVLPVNVQDRFPVGLTGFDLLAVQGTLKSLLQHHSLKAPVLQLSAFSMVQLSIHAGKTIALTRWTFVSQVICLLLNMLSRLVIAFLPRNKHLLI